MAEIWLASLLWVGAHLGVSSTPLRKILVAAIGERFYLLLFAIMAAATLANLIWVYVTVPQFEYLWLPNPDLYWFAKLIMPIALIFLVGGFMVKNPSNVGMTIGEPEQAAQLARGVTRITRHPFQWAVVLWAASHAVANGDRGSLIFFCSFLVLSLLGSMLLDRKKAATLGAGWTAYARATSNIPFVAILAGRNRLVTRELVLPVIAGLVAYALAFYFHEAYTGAIII